MIRFDENQQAAIDAAISRPFSIITGGAGTGKTTIISEITRTLKSRGEDVRLCAFAGKAAARLREACKHPSSTIHRLMQYDGSGFRLDTLEGLTVIVDEASMVSGDIMADLMRRNPKRLILVGDQAQLPPVGKAQPFHDLLALRPDLVSNLTTCYRATEAVYNAANMIRNGERPPIQSDSANEKWKCVNTGDAEATQAKIMQWVRAGMIDFQQDIILIPKNGDYDSAGTVEGLNAAISNHIRPGTEPRDFEPGDRVMNTKNLPDKDVWNGTAGTVHAVDIDGGVWVTTDIPVVDKERTKDEMNPVYTDKVLFSKAERKHLVLAYALSIHKAQGSQYRRVIMVCLNRDSYALLDRSLVYTGVTRTKQSCVIVGELAAFWRGIETVENRRTVLQELGGV